MEITKEKLIEKLNGDLAWEYAAAIQYVQHSAVITGPEYEGIQKELIIHAQEEMAHAVTLSEQIDYLGGFPAVDVAQIKVDADSKTLLEYDLEGEGIAIRRYKERIGQAEALHMYGLRRALEDILIQEEEHERDILSALGR
jgi:bacterioferritin